MRSVRALTLNLIFPEIYLLKDDGAGERIARDKQDDGAVPDRGILESRGPGFVLVIAARRTPLAERAHTGAGPGVLRLQARSPDAYTRHRGTVLERIPPRVKIRENALIELPHIMVLIDDPEKTVIERLHANASAGRYRKLYDFELMQGGGHVRGWMVNDEESIAMVAQARKHCGSTVLPGITSGSSCTPLCLIPQTLQIPQAGRLLFRSALCRGRLESFRWLPRKPTGKMSRQDCLNPTSPNSDERRSA